MIVFTGSVAAGRRVAEACGRRLIPCTLELGGKAPAVVLADADLERTARAITWGAFANSGQTCIAVERVYAEGPIYEPLVERVAKLARELRQGDPSGDVDVGAMTFAGQLDIVESQVADARARGARVLTGGKRGAAGQFFEPTVLADCTHEMAVMREETFGPLLPFMRVGGAEEAVELANDSHLGLNAYVFTGDKQHGRELAERISAGSVVINDVLSNYAMPAAPFGGVKASGLGRVHGPEGLRSFCELRHVSYDRFRPPGGRELWWYPYSRRTYALLRKGLELLFKGK
jgi:succinate-semialdehyde dehydrogenase/glutarate-semialdehyde dehydrogenase